MGLIMQFAAGSVPLAGDPHRDMAAFSGTLASVSWFAAVGSPLDAEELADCRQYLAGLGFPEIAPVSVAGWSDALAAARDPRWNQSWWEAEEAARGALEARAQEHHGATAVRDGLTRVAEAANAVVHGAAAIAIARSDPEVGQEAAALARAAAGAAAIACHHEALARLADAPADHPLHAKFRLFAAGHWPLCPINDRLLVF